MKKMFTRMVAPLLAVCMLAGCTGGTASSAPASSASAASSAPASSTQAASSEAPKQDVSFTWLINKVEIKNELEAVADAYMKQNPHVKIITEVAGGSVEPYPTRLKAKMGSNDMPALFVTEGPASITMFDEYVADLTDSKLAQLANKELLAIGTLDGKVRALPMAIEGYGIIYNKTIFKNAGIDPATITSMDALVKAAETLDSKKAELGLDAVFCLPGKEKWIIGSHMGSAYMNGEFETPYDAFKSPTLAWKNNAGYKQLIDLQMQYGIQPQGDAKNIVNLAYSDQIEKGLALGKVAMVHNGNWVSPIIKGMSPEMLENDEIGFLPTPIPGYREDCIRVIGTPYISLNAKLDENIQKEAMAFLEWLYTSDEGKALVVNTLNMIPPYSGFENFEITDPLAKDILRYMDEGRALPSMHNNLPSGFTSFMGEKVQEYITGKSWDDCVKEMIDKWAELAK